MTEPTQVEVLVLYDGVCKFCVAGLGFIARHDPALRVRFAAMQLPIGQGLLSRHGLPLTDFKSFVVLADGRVLLRSDAVLRIGRALRQPWPLLARLAAAWPRGWRDALYDVVARNRYRWFGTYDRCVMPSPAMAARFLDAN